MSLTDQIVRNAKPRARPRKMVGEKGLFLLITPAGGKYSRLRYRFAGKEKSLSLGVYPGVSFMAAQERRDEARRLLADGIDPSKARQETKAIETAERLAANSLPHVAATPDGIIEIGKGRALVRFSEDEALFVKDILSRLLGG